MSFVIVLVVVGGYVLKDAMALKKSGEEGTVNKLAQKLQSINLPPMIHFKTANVRISFWFTVPVGIATGILAATIAVGGFIGVPGMMYVMGVSALVASATELFVAFIMGFTGSIKWAYLGMVDIRMTLIILAGSLFGVQLGAIGTTYVKDYMVKFVMSTIMLIVAVSRGVAIPKYLVQLELMAVSGGMLKLLDTISYITMVLSLAIGAFIVLGAIFKGIRDEKAAAKAGGAVAYKKAGSS